MKTLIYAFNDYSKGAKALGAALGIGFRKKTLIQKDYVAGTLSSNLTIINWGNGSIEAEIKAKAKRIINKPAAVSLAGNKHAFFSLQKTKGDVRIPTFTDDQQEALDWVASGVTVMGRSHRGSCGQDIVFFEDDPEKFSSAQFWVQYKKKKEEFRVHVVNNTVVAVQRKALRTTDPETGTAIDRSTVDFRIRNHRNGFIFQRNDITVPDDVTEMALRAVKNVELDFGAVDVIWNEHEKKAYVLEVNTAPGLEGETIKDYAKAIGELIAA